jgi:hypothetical protein
MRLKTQCTIQVVLPILSVTFGKPDRDTASVGDTLVTCRQNSAEIEFRVWQNGWLARRRGSEERHWKSSPFAILGLRLPSRTEPGAGSRRRRLRARLPLDADSSRFELEIQKQSVAIDCSRSF